MNKKTIALIVVIILLTIIGVVFYFTSQNSNESQSANNTNQGEREEQTEQNTLAKNENNVLTSEENNTASEGGKILVVYYSASGNTERVAQKIVDNLGADIFEIVPVDEYTSDDLDWTDDDSRVTREHEDESLRNIELTSTTVDNWEEYDTVLIGYPIWWGIAAWPVDTFVKANDFSGKTVIPFCTSASSGFGQSGELLVDEANGGEWKDGQRFRENPSDSDIKEFTDSINQ